MKGIKSILFVCVALVLFSHCKRKNISESVLNDAMTHSQSIEAGQAPQNTNPNYGAYDYVSQFYKEVAIVVKKFDGKKRYGLLDTLTGKEIIPLKYDVIWTFENDVAKVDLNGKLGLINSAGEEIAPLKYDFITSNEEGLSTVKLDDKWGYIDNSGKEVIPLQYDMAWSLSEGLAAVKLNGKWGFINKTGKVVIPLTYDYVYGFVGGKSEVRKNKKSFYINKKGKCVEGC